MQAPPLPVDRIHHVEIVCGNAKVSSYYYRNAFGFKQVAYAGPETGVKDTVSYVLQQGQVFLVLSTPLNAEHPYADFLKNHGDAVVDIAFDVSDIKKTYNAAVDRGALSAYEPVIMGDDKIGKIQKAGIKTYGDTIHSFLDKSQFDGLFLPGFEPFEVDGAPTNIRSVDHIVGNVEDNKMNYWVDWYKQVFGFHHFANFDDKDISTEFSALRSVVVANDNEMIKMPINEPADGRMKSQIQEYIDSNGKAGVQHIAVTTPDIVDTVARLKEQGVEFLEIPDTYYEELEDRVGPIDEEIAQLKELGVLVDRDDKGYLLQLFTKPVLDRPQLFFEIIQRKGCLGFGKGNFKALFESIEREQRRRGNV